MSDSIPTLAVPAVYRLGLVVGALLLVLLPCSYGALVLLAGYGVFCHATEQLTLLDNPGSTGGLLLYVTPLVLGVVMVLFLIKPLFAPRGGR